MPTISYQILNVFAESSFGGNPLAFVEDGGALSDEQMQSVARQFNLSETTFLLPSARAAARVRIFTPSYEMPFAGHPTLGSAAVVSALLGAGEQFALEMKAGVIPVWREDGRWHLSVGAAKQRPMEATTAELAAMLGLPQEAIAGPASWFDCGTEQPMIELRGVADVRACKPVAALLARHSRNASGQPKAYVFARSGDGFEARYFWMSNDSSVSEDPGTGSACANLGAWWQATEGGRALDAVVHQGGAIGRPSQLTLKVADGKIAVGGRVVALGKGELSW
ncbi:PhzF family phenazine biosynthesis protein [Massilia glaciei]|uniref:PhzF family phenazine biosynthesis protein n=1 Tax=Massilia glaciei TaxID=1524097 RepID=A0A2U2I4I9_9BURK|nr:PhzF family phenazine biosynthesis protein [Massilia glaciei]PWF54686.1 PhzF family phenazine biosynthesis protein [Massilia glaciei]